MGKSNSMTFKLGRREYDLAERTYIMGVLNVTPDSFSDGGKYLDCDRAVTHALEIIRDGADIIDIGGESSRPGSKPLAIDEELGRVIPVIEAISRSSDIPISIDTMKSEVAERALRAGASIVNDISGLTHDKKMVEMIADYQATAVIMHMKGSPADMQENPQYADVVGEVKSFLLQQSEFAAEFGVNQIIIDPGIGFGKNLEHNLTLLRNIDQFLDLGYPVLIGPSRKSFIGTLLDLPISERLEGTAAAVAASIIGGASIVRVHDVKEMKRVAVVTDAVKPSAKIVR